MTVARTVADVLDDHTVFEIECIDRMYLNVYVPQLQYTAGLVGFVHRQVELPIASTAPLGKTSDAFTEGIRRYACDQGVPMVDFVRGRRKDDVMHEHSSARPTTPTSAPQWRTNTGAELMTDTPDVPEQHQTGQPRPPRTIDRTISATCQTHGAKGFCNLRVTKTDNGIVLNPHVAGACVITLDEAGTAALRDLLIEWQARPAAG